jgi:hypothetical protein
MFTRPFVVTVEFAVRFGIGVCVTAGVFVVIDDVIMGELEFAVVVFMLVGLLHPATTIQPIRMKRVRGRIMFRGIRNLFFWVIINSTPDFILCL